MPLWSRPIACSPLGKRKPRPHHPPPPLAKVPQICVMQRHLDINPPNLPACPAQAQAQLRLLTGDQAGVVSTHRPYRRKPHQCIAPASQRRTQRSVPFHIRQPVIHRRLGKPLATPPTDHHRATMHRKPGQGRRKPALPHLAVSIDELHKLWVLQHRQSRIARPRRREPKPQVQRHHLGTHRARSLDRAIRRPRIDINQPPHPALQRPQTGDQPHALVAPDHHRVNHCILHQGPLRLVPI